MVSEWVEALRGEDENKSFPNTPLPPSFLAFLILAKLSNYGIKVSLYELEHLDAKIIMEWFLIMQIVSPRDLNLALPLPSIL